ncbi:MAG: excinuclease ABC subunit UvrA, partial [Chloroflexi bacterium]|nr:excinuclease ABC subunit UvrA [Chloroflexota bacterium]
MKKSLKSGLDFTDLRHGIDFNVAAAIWKQARAGEIKPDRYRANKRWKGWPCLRGNLLHDFQALNRTELMLWDYWDELSQKPENEMRSKDRAILDHIANLTLHPDETFAEMRATFEELPRTAVIRSRLYLLGIIGQGAVTVADALQPSDFERLTAVTNPPKAITSPESSPKRVEHGETAVAPPDSNNHIIVQGARQHNLKNIDVHIPRNQFVVITGVSGSGKSSLAFDTIYAEGQRRYVESLSSFARQFTRQIEKPQVDKVIGLNPAVAIEQSTVSPNSRSTVGSMTGVIDYLRVLFARVGQMHCPQCGRTVAPQTAQQISNRLLQLAPGTSFQILAPASRAAGLDAADILRQAQENGLSQARVDGIILQLDETEAWPTEAERLAEIEWLIADFISPETESVTFHVEILQAVERGLGLGNGRVLITLASDTFYLTSENQCPSCNIHLPKPEPQLLNPNSVFGMCAACDGLGLKLQVDPALIISKPHRSLLDDASSFYPYSNLRKSSSDWWRGQIEAVAAYYGADLERPWQELPESFRNSIIYGSGGQKIDTEFTSEDGGLTVQRKREWHGAIHHINRLYRQTKSESMRRRYRMFMSQQPCPDCQGERLSKEARFITLADKRFPEVSDQNIGDLLGWIRSMKLRLNEQQQQIGDELIAEIEQRLQFICDVGLHYLSLQRPAPTLSGGEAQRIRLASQMGSELTGVLYVLDEPTIGLHPRDQQALLNLLLHLRDAGNTVLVVEHDADTMRAADWLIDLGPGAGVLGGELVAAGTPAQVMAEPDSLTGRYLSGNLQVMPLSDKTGRSASGWLNLKGARLHNLKKIDVNFPLGTFTCITGVSGSGKSSLITRTLYPALAQALHRARRVPGVHDSLEGITQIDKVIHITQQPIGRNPRSNPGTYVGVWAEIRKCFAQTAAAKALSYGAGHFSFNVAGGRCEACEGYGARKVKMHFMADVWVMCQECNGRRFNRQTLAVQINRQSIADVLEMDVQ